MKKEQNPTMLILKVLIFWKTNQIFIRINQFSIKIEDN